MEVWQIALLIVAIVIAIGFALYATAGVYLWKNVFHPIIQTFQNRDKSGK